MNEKDGKVCLTCKTFKEYSKFYKSKNYKNGFHSRCRDCFKERDSKYREDNREYFRKYGREWAKRNRKKATENVLNWQKNNPSKKYEIRLKAKRLSQYIEVTECEECGNTEDLHRHHADYNKPLEIMALCRPCHIEWHKNNEAIYPK